MVSSIANSALVNDLGPRLAARPLERECRRSDRRVGLALLYHGVARNQGDGRTEVVPDLACDLLGKQLEYLRRRYEVVPIGELRARVGARTRGQRIPVALTFDDDLQSHVAITAPLLADMSLAATFFLTGSSLHEHLSFWWHDLQAVVDRGDGSWEAFKHELMQTLAWDCADADIHQIAYAIGMAPPRERDPIADLLRQIAGPPAANNGLSAEGVRELVKGGFEIGFHTRHHYFLQALDRKELESAMREGLEELETVVGYRPTAIAYPYCKADFRVASAARDAGFTLGFVCRSGPATATQNPLLLDRVSGETESLGRFAWRLALASLREPIKPL